MGNNVKSKYIIIFFLIQMMGLNSCYQEVQEEQYISLITHCDNDLCKSVLYDIKLSKHNLTLKVKEGFVGEEEVIKYCLTTNTGCGAHIYFVLKKLIDKDHAKFKFLEEKYNIKDKELFLSSIAQESLKKTISNINDIENDVSEICNCK
jgi:hypothetical protein